MKKLLIISSVILVLMIIATWNNSKPKNIIARVVERGNGHPQELKFRIDILGLFPIGEAVIMPGEKRFYQNKEAYYLSAYARIPGWLSPVFSSEASISSYMDARTLEPLLFKEKVIMKNKPDKEKEIIYDQKSRVMTIEGERRNIFAGTHDPLSALASIRGMDFGQVKDFRLNINTNQKNYILQAKVRPSFLVVSGKKYQIAFLEASISRGEGNPYHKSKINMVVLRDKENLPLIIKVFAGGVFLTAKLTEIK